MKTETQSMSVTDFEKSRKYRENREADASRTINEYRHRNRLLTIELDKARQTIKDKEHADHCACEKKYAELVGIISSGRTRSMTDEGRDHTWRVMLPMTNDEYWRFVDLISK